MTETDLLKQLNVAVLEGEDDTVRHLAEQAIAQGLDPLEVIDRGLTPAIQDVGQRFGCGEAFLPELIISTKAMIAGLDLLNEAIIETGKKVKSLGTVILGTVQGDIHSIGKDILASLYRVRGFAVVDLGVDVADEVFVQKARELRPDVMGMSALLTTTMARQRDVIQKLEEAGLRDGVKVLVGGAPVTPTWAEEIGADGMAPDAQSAVELTVRLLQGG